MKRSEVVEGAEYAAGGTGRYDRWLASRVRVEKVGADGPGQFGRTVKNGILIEFIGDGRYYPFAKFTAGERIVLKTARELLQPWPAYAEAKAAHEKTKRAKEGARDRQREVGERSKPRLRALGYETEAYGAGCRLRYTERGAVWEVTPDVMADLLARIPT
jgi:hypothetical protein